MMKNYLPGRSKKNRKSSKGSAITEAAVGALVLMPIFLILVDLISLVVGQTINDDIAKNAGRYAAQGTDITSGELLAANYMLTCPYTTTAGGLINSVVISKFTWNTPNSVTVYTEAIIKLPVEVPFLNIKQQVMQSQSTWPITGIAATPPVP